MLNKQCGGFDFLKKNFEILYFARVRARYKFSLVFRLSLVCSKFKLKFFVVIQLFGLKTTSHGKYDLKNEFLGQIYHVKWFSDQRIEYPRRTLTLTCCILG